MKLLSCLHNPTVRRVKSARRRLTLSTLEVRCTPAAVSWDGGAATLNWSDAKNWNPDGVPGAADEVTIDDVGIITVLYTGGATAIKSLVLQENLTVSGGSLTVSGSLAINSTYTLRTGASGASFTAMGATTANGANIVAQNGSTLSLPGLTSYDGLAVSVPTLHATGMGSVLDLSKMTTLKGSTANYVTLAASGGGKLDLNGLTAVTSGGTNFTADGVGSVLAASQLAMLNATGQCYLIASNGGLVSMPGLTGFDGLSTSPSQLSANGVGSVLDVSGITSLKGSTGNISTVTATGGGKIDLSKLTTIAGGRVVLTSSGTGSLLTASILTTLATTTPSQLTATNGGQVNMPALANANGTGMLAQGGSTLSLPGLTSYDGLTVSVPTLQASGMGSVLDLSKMTSLKGSTANYATLQATLGGKLDLSGLTMVTGGGTYINADGVGSVVAAGQLATLNPGDQSYLIAGNGGLVNMPALTSYDGLSAVVSRLEANGVGAVLNLSNVTSLKGSTGNISAVTATGGGKIDLSKLTTIAGGRVVLTSSGTGSLLTAGVLTTLATSTPSQLTATNGGQVNMPALAKANGTGMLAQGGSTLSLPGLTSYDGLTVSVPTLQASGMGSVLDLSKMTSLKGSTANYATLQATLGGKLDLSGLTMVTGGGTYINADGVGSVVAAGQLATLNPGDQSFLIAGNGGLVNMPALTIYDGLNAVISRLEANGVGSVLNLSNITSLKGSTANISTVSATGGGKIDLSKLTTIASGRVVLTSSGTGSLLTAGDLTTLATTTPSQLTATNGGQVNMPVLANANGTGILAQGGSTLSLPGLTSYDGLAISTPTLQASGMGSVLDLSKMTSLKGSTANYTQIFATLGGKLDLSGLTSFTIGGVFIQTDGAGSLMVASQLATLNPANDSSVYALNGGTIQLPSFGPTSVSKTAVRILNGGAISTNRLDVGTGSTLDADTLGGSLSGVGIVRPASSVSGPLTIAGNVSLSAGSSLETRISSAGSFDSLVVNGTVTLAGTTLVATISYSANPGATFTIIDNDNTDPVSGTFVGLAEGAASGIGGQNFVVSYKGGTGNDVTLTRTFPSKVSGVVINDGATQRSRVTKFAVTFDQHVTLPTIPTEAFELSRQSDGKLPTMVASVDDTGPGTVVTFTFSGSNAVDFGSLADGRYTLSIFASKVGNANGPLDGNGDGIGGDDYTLIGNPTTAPKLFRLFGDADGNGNVGTADFIAFRLAFGGSSTIFDFDGVGGVGTIDFNAFRTRFGSSI